MTGTHRISGCEKDAENYVYRGLMATIVVANAFGGGALVEQLYKFLAVYEAANGHTPPSPRGA